MPQFRYQALSASGEPLQGQMEADLKRLYEVAREALERRG